MSLWGSKGKIHWSGSFLYAWHTSVWYMLPKSLFLKTQRILRLFSLFFYHNVLLVLKVLVKRTKPCENCRIKEAQLVKHLHVMNKNLTALHNASLNLQNKALLTDYFPCSQIVMCLSQNQGRNNPVPNCVINNWKQLINIIWPQASVGILWFCCIFPFKVTLSL